MVIWLLWGFTKVTVIPLWTSLTLNNNFLFQKEADLCSRGKRNQQRMCIWDSNYKLLFWKSGSWKWEENVLKKAPSMKQKSEKKWGLSKVTLSAPMTKWLKWKSRVCSRNKRGCERRMSLPSWGFSSLPEWKGFLLMRTVRGLGEGWDEPSKGFLFLGGGRGCQHKASKAAQRGNSVCYKVIICLLTSSKLSAHYFLDLAAGLVSCLLCRTTPTQTQPNMLQVNSLS